MLIKYWLNAAFGVASLAQNKHVCGLDEYPCPGSCVGLTHKCDGQFDCPDGSDEALSLCKDSGRPIWPILFHCSAVSSQAQTPSVCPAVCTRRPGLCSYALLAEHGAPGTCKLPPYPEHGSYSVSERLKSDTFTLHYSCDGQYNLHGANHVRCQGGKWQEDYPTCKINTGTYSIADTDVRK